MNRAVDFHDKNGSPITKEQWWSLHDNEDYKHVGKTEVGRQTVSTIWALLGDFETVVFDGRGGAKEIARYNTQEEAQAGHEEAVRSLSEGSR
jgi:hypothetical protein